VKAGKIAYFLMFLGLVLMPFSTPPRGMESFTLMLLPWFENLGVFHFGLPFLGLGAVLFTIILLAEKERPSPSALLPLTVAALYLICIICFTLVAEDVFVSAVRAGVNVVGFLVFFTILKSRTKARQEESGALIGFIRAFIISGMVMAGYFIINLAFQGSEHEQTELFSERFVGGMMGLPWGASNTIASALLLPLVFSFAYFELTKRKLLFGISSALLVAAILLTVSRNGLACLVLFCVLYWVFITRSRVLLLILLAGVTLAVVNWLAQGGSIDFLLQSRFGDENDLATFNGRLDLWTIFFQHITTNPFDPVGYYGSLETFEISPHNWFLVTYVEMGPIGLLTSGLFFGYSVYQAIQLMRHRTKGLRGAGRVLLIGTVIIFLNLQFEDPEFTQAYIIYFWVFMGLLFSLPSERARDSSERLPFRQAARLRPAAPTAGHVSA
jgi:O-antigen ligase